MGQKSLQERNILGRFEQFRSGDTSVYCLANDIHHRVGQREEPVQEGGPAEPPREPEEPNVEQVDVDEPWAEGAVAAAAVPMWSTAPPQRQEPMDCSALNLSGKALYTQSFVSIKQKISIDCSMPFPKILTLRDLQITPDIHFPGAMNKLHLLINFILAGSVLHVLA